MTNPAKIFISSANEPALREIRKELKASLTNAGHRVLIFEDGDFAPWDKDTLQTCIDKVKECQIFILLIGEKSGTYLNNLKTTPTYIEFHTAVEEGLYIIPYVQCDVKNNYLWYMQSEIKQKIEIYERENGRRPNELSEIVGEIIESHTEKEKLNGIDSFVWEFISDVEYKCGWLYSLDYKNKDEFYEEVKHYLSTQLAIGIKFVPLKEEIISNAGYVEEYQKFQRYTNNLLSLLDGGIVKDWERFLAFIVRELRGGKIVDQKGYLSRTLNEYENCNAASMYKCEGSQMHLITYQGAITPPEEYPLDDKESFVVDTYIKDAQSIYYSMEKQLLYFAIKAGKFVLCFHFPLKKRWTNDQVSAFHNEYREAIIESSSAVFVEFAIRLLGGIIDEG
ncbi:DUF4062 domain-containing protein [Lysinibacillus fusiformis]|uniref:DUF4062 domain-containing protein n=1 Tax=Lysinibacillus fusiformis TaxID=28031 RepID=A0A2I0UVM7_9BACI|nr:DUF4062 domain-containing protein [Lysinibacillus fusiformis]PKU50093.1 hypothetical protein CRI88_19860 [Lysinibacillus fusiformis]